MSRLSKFIFSCHQCEQSLHVDYDNLNELIKSKGYLDDEDLNLGNINTIIEDIFCSKCNREGRGKVKDFSLLDANKETLFDTRAAVICDSCDLMIPIPRIKSNPDITTCMTCTENEESKKDGGLIFPKFPKGVTRNCPEYDCDGLAKVYFNNSDKTFFIGCSNYIGPRRGSCRWSTNEFFAILNNSDKGISNNYTTSSPKEKRLNQNNTKVPGWITNNSIGRFNFSPKKSFVSTTVEQIPHDFKGIYRIWKKRESDDVCVYIGISDTCLRRRIEEHYPDKEKNKKLRNILQSNSELLIDLKIMNDKVELIRQHERKLIQLLRPDANIEFNKKE